MAHLGSAFSTKEFEHLPSAGSLPEASCLAGGIPFVPDLLDGTLFRLIIDWHYLPGRHLSCHLLGCQSGLPASGAAASPFLTSLSGPNTCPPSRGGPIPGPQQHT